MKFTKQFILPALVGCGILVSVVSCTDESIESTDVAVKSKSASARKLVALEDIDHPNEADFKRYVKLYETLSFDEAIEHRKLREEKEILEKGNTPEIIAAMEKDMQRFKSINLKAMELYKKPMNQLNSLQMDEVFSFNEAKESKQANNIRPVCQVVPFNYAFTNANTGNPGNVTFQVISVREVSQPGSPKDCDCQVAFNNTNKKYDKIYSTSIQSYILLRTFGTYINGRFINGASSGAYPVIGRNRVEFAYLVYDDFLPICENLRNQLVLSDARPNCTGGDVWWEDCQCCETRYVLNWQKNRNNLYASVSLFH